MADAAPEDGRGRRHGHVLAELSQLPNVAAENGVVSPKASSPDEMIIQQRGPRVKPVNWSPVDWNKLSLLRPPRDRTPERQPARELRPGLRRRLTLSPVKSAHLDSLEVKRCKAVPFE